MKRPGYTHITIECQSCAAAVLSDRGAIRKLLRSVASVCNLHVVREGWHAFRPQGITGYVLLRESHISIHTWPELRFALVDVLSCANLDSERLSAHVRDGLRAGSIAITTDVRRRSSAKAIARE